MDMIKILKCLRTKRKNWRTQVTPMFSALLNSVENEVYSVSLGPFYLGSLWRVSFLVGMLTMIFASVFTWLSYLWVCVHLGPS